MKDYKPLVSSAPAHSILNAQTFHYTSSVTTDIRKTFVRVLRNRAKSGVVTKGASNIRHYHPARNPPIVADQITWSARAMTIDEHAHLSPAKLGELIRHLTRSEQDMQEGLTAREKHVRNAQVDKPDPIRKRFFFLLLKQSRHRRAVEPELATRDDTVGTHPFALKADPATTSTFMTVATPAHHVPARVDRPTANRGSVNAWRDSAKRSLRCLPRVHGACASPFRGDGRRPDCGETTCCLPSPCPCWSS